MNAANVEPERIGVTNADDSNVEGAITLFNSSASFAVSGVSVVTNSATIFEGGIAGDLALGVEVEVEGVLSSGVLTAKNVSFRDDVEIEGDAATVTSGGSTPNLTVSSLPGITVTVNSQTVFKGGIASLADLVPGNHVQARGRPIGANIVVAAELEKLSSSPQVILQGAVQSVANPNVTVLAVPINTSGISDNNFKGLNDVIIGRAAFLSTVQVGTLVKAKGNWNGSSVIWSEIEIDSN
jgi:hypothetical protein